MSALLEVQNLVKLFPVSGSRKVVQAVNGVDFTINRGETLALVGESGSGKTTVGRAVVGLIEATAGEIWFDGKRMGRGRNIRSSDLRGRIQLVFQEPAESLDPRIRVGETLGEPLRYLGLSRADRDARVRDVVSRLGLAERVVDQFPLELSAGQQQRVAVARARDAPRRDHRGARWRQPRGPMGVQRRGGGTGDCRIIHPDHLRRRPRDRRDADRLRL